jgi:hypothetical protein
MTELRREVEDAEEKGEGEGEEEEGEGEGEANTEDDGSPPLSLMLYVAEMTRGMSTTGRLSSVNAISSCEGQKEAHASPTSAGGLTLTGLEVSMKALRLRILSWERKGDSMEGAKEMLERV